MAGPFNWTAALAPSLVSLFLSSATIHAKMTLSYYPSTQKCFPLSAYRVFYILNILLIFKAPADWSKLTFPSFSLVSPIFYTMYPVCQPSSYSSLKHTVSFFLYFLAFSKSGMRHSMSSSLDSDWRNLAHLSKLISNVPSSLSISFNGLSSMPLFSTTALGFSVPCVAWISSYEFP